MSNAGSWRNEKSAEATCGLELELVHLSRRRETHREARVHSHLGPKGPQQAIVGRSGNLKFYTERMKWLKETETSKTLRLSCMTPLSQSGMVLENLRSAALVCNLYDFWQNVIATNIHSGCSKPGCWTSRCDADGELLTQD